MMAGITTDRKGGCGWASNFAWWCLASHLNLELGLIKPKVERLRQILIGTDSFLF